MKPTPGDMVPFKTTVCGIDELNDHCDVGVSHVLSILDPDAPEPPVFGAFSEHERVELRFDDVIEDFPDKVAPRRQDVEEILAFGRDLVGESSATAHLLVHCHAGVSRSTAAMTLILAQARSDLAGDEILAEVAADSSPCLAQSSHHRIGRCTAWSEWCDRVGGFTPVSRATTSSASA